MTLEDGVPASGCESRTILAIDDELLVLSLLEMMLKRHGFHVLTAANARQALELFHARRSQIDLVITDIVMPEMDGAALAATLLEMKPDLPVLFISGFAERLERLQAPILAKPFSTAALISKVQALLAA